MRLVHVSDLHFGAVDPAMPACLRDAILAAHPELVVVSGDLTQRGRPQEFREAKAFLDSIPLPQLVVPGNHDVQGSWLLWQRFLSPWRNYRSIIGTNLEPVWKSPGLIVVGLNSARPAGWYLDWSRGRLSRGQMSRLSHLFDEAPDEALHVLVVHHPPAAPPLGTARHLIGRLREFTAAVNQAGVDLVLAGHFHMSYAQAMPLFGTPTARSCVFSAVSTATSHRLKGEPNGFHLVEGDVAGLRIEDWAWTGATYQARRSWTFESNLQTRAWRLISQPSDDEPPPDND